MEQHEQNPPEVFNQVETGDVQGLNEGAVHDALTTHKLSVNSLEYRENNSLDDMLQGAKILIESNVLPNFYSEPEQVVGAIKMGYEYGLPAMIALNNIYMIEGKPTLNVHLIGALLIKGGWSFKVVEMPNQNNDSSIKIRFLNEKKLRSLNEEIVGHSKYPEDVRNHLLQNLSHIEAMCYHDVTFSWGEAVAMELASRRQWQKMPVIMMFTRCLSIGARRVAPNLMMGMMEAAEWGDVKKIDIGVKEDGSYTME